MAWYVLLILRSAVCLADVVDYGAHFYEDGYEQKERVSTAKRGARGLEKTNIWRGRRW